MPDIEKISEWANIGFLSKNQIINSLLITYLNGFSQLDYF
jgi:hypothetical protein